MHSTEKSKQPKYTITLAQNRSQKEWTDARSGIWGEFQTLLTTHQAGKKDGICYTPAVFRGVRRTKKEALKIGLGVLDCDTGETFTEIRKAITEAGYSAIIHSTYSHMTTETKVSRSEWDKSGYTDAAAYLRDFKYMRKTVANGAVLEDRGDTETYTIVHNPCSKFRIIIPLEKPWEASDYHSQEEANADWEKKIKSLAARLGLHHDQSCIDTSRLYYLPRHAKGAEYITEVIDGVPCNLDETAPYTETPHETAVARPSTKSTEQHVYECPETGNKVNLTQWAAQHAGSFNIVEALKKRKPEKFTGRVVDGCKHHVRCINESAHTKQGEDGATFIIDPEKSETGSFVYHCMHAHCRDLDRLFFIRKMLEERWLTIEVLYPDDQNPPLSYEEIAAWAEQFDKETSPDEIEKVIHEINNASLSAVHRESVFKIIAAKTPMTLKALRETSAKAKERVSGDVAYDVAIKTLSRFYAQGTHLVRAGDRQFWQFNGKFWQPLRDELIEQKILVIVQEVVDPSEDGYRKIMRDALDLLKSRQAIDDRFFENIGNIPSVINFKNGELWLNSDGTVLLKEHNPSSYLTYCLNIDFDPLATCERFDMAVRETFARALDTEEMVRHFEETLAYIVQPSRFLTCFFMWLGVGNNGKTTMYGTLERLMSATAISAERIGEIEKSRFALGELMGKMLLVDDDVDTGTKLPDGLIKKLSERKRITGEKKFKDKFNFVSSVAILLLANNPPLSADISHGMIRRVKIIPFNRKFTEVDADNDLFPYIWKHEMPGVMNRLIEALQRLRRRGDFKEPEECVQARMEWLASANPLTGFMDEMCERDSDASVTIQALLHAFRNWAKVNDVRISYTNRKFRLAMEGLGYTCSKKDGRWRIKGLKLSG